MKDIKSIFRNLEKKLKQAKWFEDDWEIYNRGPYLQLYKSSWHNHNQGGIHFETYIEAPQITQKSFPICLHAEEDCPSRSEFMQRFLELEEERIKGWKGYQIIAKDHHILQKTLPLNFKNLEQRLYDELSQLSKLESSIEQALQELGS
ncbi:hypothetical protein [Marinomonas posidonica]|uniref:hypothetical protein n=1 Tax=Marinomonas posidonica TaxID=936476 RepID=UPI0037356A3F